MKGYSSVRSRLFYSLLLFFALILLYFMMGV